jgi:hypothetical protein
MVVK